MSEIKLNETKLKRIKYQVITTEKENIIKKDPDDSIVKNIKNYIEKVVKSNVD